MPSDRLLELPSETLQGTDQKPTDPEGLRALVQGLLWHRAAEHRALVAADASTFSLSVQTRNVAQVYDRTGGQLDIRVRPSAHERLPDGEGLRDLALTIGLLPDAVTRSGAQRVRLTGGAHLSVAFAIGAALPSSRVAHLDVGDQRRCNLDQRRRSDARATCAPSSQGLRRCHASDQRAGRGRGIPGHAPEPERCGARALPGGAR